MLVDDHAALLEPLAFMFEHEPDFAVVGAGRVGSALVAALPAAAGPFGRPG
mgnify:CR=1 FL=1